MSSGSSEDQDFFRELRQEFLVEASFLLEQADESCLKLEVLESRKGALDEVFRIFHSIKGGGAAVGFKEMSEVAHMVENCLSVLRSYPDLINPEVISILFKASDAFRERIHALKEGDSSKWEVEELRTAFKALTEELNGKKTEAESREEERAGTPIGAKEPEAITIINRDHRETVKVSTQNIDTVLDLIGELVVIKSQLLHDDYLRSTTNIRLHGLVSLFDKTVRELQDKALQMRMTPLKQTFLRTQRHIRELAHKLKKPTNLTVEGEDTEIDRNLIELVGDPLIHLVSNAVDHGIESVEEREKCGKPQQASISLQASQAHGRITIQIRDDGRGIDREKIIKSAVERKLLSVESNPESMSNREVYKFLFIPGFSTTEEITDVSGRGVGLDVVKANIEKIKGTIEIDSVLGKGTTFQISIPLTTAIFDGMVVVVGNTRYILPVDKISEFVQLRKLETSEVSGQQMINVREELVPLISLQDMLKATQTQCAQDVSPERERDTSVSKVDEDTTSDCEGEKDIVIIVQHKARKLGLRLQAILGQAQVVIKPLGTRFKDIPDVSGAAILGDGKVALIVDIDGIASRLEMPDGSGLIQDGPGKESNSSVVCM